MTEQDRIKRAIAWTESRIDGCAMPGARKMYETCLSVLREKLERMPKPVIAYTEEDMEFVHYKCPKCEIILQQHFKRSRDPFTYSQKFCHECGQALDWHQTEGGTA